jgi:hypothetical protein
LFLKNNNKKRIKLRATDTFLKKIKMRFFSGAVCKVPPSLQPMSVHDLVSTDTLEVFYLNMQLY